MTTMKAWLLKSRPVGVPTQDNWEMGEMPVPTADEGEYVAETLFLSIDPYMRGRMNDAKSYAAPVPIGGVMEGGTVGRVIESKSDRVPVGSYVLGQGGWATHWKAPGKLATLVDADTAPLSSYVGMLGMPGMTAWAGLHNIGKPQEGETLCVAAATGPVGSMVGQIAKAKGLRAVGIAGGADKCAFAVDELGFDACLDRNDPDLAAKLKEATPNGIDIYWENVGGPVFETVWPRLNPFSRVPVCGVIHHYNATEVPMGENWGPRIFRDILTKRILVKGFIVWDYGEQQSQFVEEIVPLIKQGAIKVREDVSEGLESAPQSLIDVLQGANFGKKVIKVA